MSYNSWSLGRGGVPYGHGGGGGGGERQRDEAVFASLFPVNGKVAGSQVKNVFQTSGLPQQQLAHIWTMADGDGDGYINVSEFCSAVAAIRQAKIQQQQTMSLQWPGRRQGHVGLKPMQSLDPSLSQSVPMIAQSPQQVGGGGRSGVSVGMVTTTEGWGMSPAERRRYGQQFGSLDRGNTGYLVGTEVKPVLHQSGLEQALLAKIWMLADIDKDGRLSQDEFVIAMHLIERAKKGVSLPVALPPELLHIGNPSQKDGPSSSSSSSSSVTSVTGTPSKSTMTFEDKKKENFDAGRQELERRRRTLQEKQEREEAEKERKRRQEEEQRKQQELEAEKRRKAELERQNRRSLEIQRERERQLARLAEQREAELREEERKRKEEWARRRLAELEGVKQWEMRTLRALQSQHSNLENELQQLDQEKVASKDSVQRQSSLCNELRAALRSIRLSDEIKRTEIAKLRTELQGLQSKLSSLASQREQLQASLQTRNPQSQQYQRERQVYQDGIMGVAAVLAGLRSTLKSGTEAYQKQRDLMNNNEMMLSNLNTELQKGTAKTPSLKAQVAHHRSLWEERERRGREETRRRQEAEKKEKEERQRRERREREEKIKREQAEAFRIARETRAQEEKAKQAAELNRLLKKGTTSPSPSPPQTTPTHDSTTTPVPIPRPNPKPFKPAPYQSSSPASEAIAKLSVILRKEHQAAASSTNVAAMATTTAGGKGKKEVKEKDKEKEKEREVKKKVSELKEKKKELEKQQKRPPKPTPYNPDKKKRTSVPIIAPAPLLDFETSYDSSGQSSGFVPNPESSFNPLQPQRTGSEPTESSGESSPTKTDHPPTVRPRLKSGQGLANPAVTEKAKPTVTGSQVEALSSNLEPLYATVNKERTHTRSNLDFGERRAGPTNSVSPPPRDWILVGKEDATQSDGERVVAAHTVPSVSDAPMPYTPVFPLTTSSPKRVNASPALLTSSNSGGGPVLSASWENIQSAANQARGEGVKLPSPQQPDTESTEAASSVTTTTSHGVSYRAIYSFAAEQDTEISLNEGDTVDGIPGELPSNGWLLVEVRGQRGLVPEAYLEEAGVGGGGEGGGGGGEGVVEVKRESSVERKLAAASQEVDHAAAPGEKAKVMYSWKGSKDNHLGIKKGQFVRILSKSEKWWSGEVEGRVGWFPKTFVKLVEGDEGGEGGGEIKIPQVKLSPETTPTPSVAKEMYCALYDYESSEPCDLQFKGGDIIEVSGKEGGWWKGSLNGKSGVFPCNYVEPHTVGEQPRPPSPSSSLPSRSSAVPPSPSPSLSSLASDVSVTTHTKPLVARVTQPYEATKDTELTLKAGQYIKVSKQTGSGWWFGELQSRGKAKQTGWFPADHVDLLQKKANVATTVPNTTPPPSLGQPSSGQPSSGQQQATGGAVSGVLGAQRARSPLIDILDPPEPSTLSQNLVLALYTYTAVSSDELTFHKGSVITVLSKKGDWWKGELNNAVGLFPSNYVQPLNENLTASEATRWAESVSPEVLASVTKTERKRQEAIFELLSSERNYTDSLKFVREVFFEPMAGSGVLTDEEMSKIRVNWDELIQYNGAMLNAFLVRLRTSGSVVKTIGDILHTQIPLLVPHVRWCSCQLTACTLLQSKTSDPQYKEFEQKCAEDPRAAGLPLSSFLLKPMQRITKYPLLIQRILDYTPEDHLDYEELKGALGASQKLCHSVNEAVRLKENTEQLEWLQTNVQFSLDERLVFNSQTNFMGQRKLLHWGKLFKIRGNRDLVGFLFNDFFLLVKPKNFFSRAATPTELEPFGKNEFVMYRTPYLLGDVIVNKAPSDQHGPSVFLMNYPSEEKDIPLKADSDPARDVWIKVIQDAKNEYLKTKRRSEQEMKKKWAHTMKHTVGVLKVTVVKAEDLMASDPNGKSDPFCVLHFNQQEESTPVVPNSLNPKWNYTMQFNVHDLNKDVLEITVFDQDIFSPNDFLGCGRVVLKDLLQEGDSPWRKQVLLEDVSRGELELVIELTLNKSDLLL